MSAFDATPLPADEPVARAMQIIVAGIDIALDVDDLPLTVSGRIIEMREALATVPERRRERLIAQDAVDSATARASRPQNIRECARIADGPDGIAALRLSNQTWNSLIWDGRGRYLTITALDAAPDRDLLSIHGIGRGRLAEIRAAIDQHRARGDATS